MMTSLQDDLERLRTLFEAIPDPAFLKDGHGRWLEANAAAIEAFGLEGVDYRGLTDLELSERSEFYREAHLFCIGSDNKAWSHTGTYHAEEVLPRPDGTSRTYDTFKVPLFYPDGSRKGIVIIGRDITDRTKLAQMKTQFLGIAAHELRTPLTPMLLLLETLLLDGAAGRPVKPGSIERIIRLTKRMALLVNELLDAVRLERDSMSITRVPVNMGELIESVAADFRLGDAKRRIEVTRPEEATIISADPSRIQQVLGNLLSNALKYSTGTVEIRLLPESQGIRVEVQDHGPGIAPDQQTGIFTRFYRVSTDVNIKSPGLGLGLFIAYEIIHRHGGEIGLHSELGHGSIFHFSLPREPISPT